jgi:hypothetical protein
MPRAHELHLTPVIFSSKNQSMRNRFISLSMIQNDQAFHLIEGFSGGWDVHGTDKKRI